MRLTVILPTARSPYGKEAPALPSPHTDADAGGRPALLTYARPNPATDCPPCRGLAGFPRFSAHAGTIGFVVEEVRVAIGDYGRAGVPDHPLDRCSGLS